MVEPCLRLTWSNVRHLDPVIRELLALYGLPMPGSALTPGVTVSDLSLRWSGSADFDLKK